MSNIKFRLEYSLDNRMPPETGIKYSHTDNMCNEWRSLKLTVCSEVDDYLMNEIFLAQIHFPPGE